MDAFKMNLPGLAIVVLATMPAASSVMNIWMKDGRKVEYDTAQISSISFTEGEAAGEGDSAAFTEDFRGGLSETWDSYGVVGGDFQRFARVESGRLVVRVPEGNSWAKTGIYSKEPFVTISESPVSVEVELDPKDTTGVCVAFSAAKDHDIWRQQTVWVTWAKVSETGGSAYFANTQNGSEHFGEIKTGPTAPRSIKLTLQAGKATLSMAGYKSATQNFGWLKAGTGAYFTVFSHPARQYAPVNLAVKAVKVYR